MSSASGLQIDVPCREHGYIAPTLSVGRWPPVPNPAHVPMVARHVSSRYVELHSAARADAASSCVLRGWRTVNTGQARMRHGGPVRR